MPTATATSNAEPLRDPYADPPRPPLVQTKEWDDPMTGLPESMIERDMTTGAPGVHAMRASNLAASMAFVHPDYFSAGAATGEKLRAAIPNIGAFSMRAPNMSTATGGGILGDFADIFGQTSRLGQDGVTDEGLRDAEIPNREQTYSDLSRNQTRRLATQMNHYMRLDDSVYTAPGGLAPLKPTNDTSITYDEMIFNPEIIRPTPELAPVRFMGYRKKTFQHAFVRYGVGIRGTTDFMKSAEGRAIVAQQLLQILNSIHETLAFGCIYAILTSDHVQRQKVRRWRRYQQTSAMYELLDDERMRWDMLKYEQGIHKADAIARLRIEERHGEADTWLLAPEATVFMALELKTATSVSESGERLALGARQDSINAVKQWMDSKVVILRTYSVDATSVQNPLQFRAQIGEYYITTNSLHGRYDNSADFDPLSTSVEIYDETRDQWALIDTATCLRNCTVFDPATGQPQNSPTRNLQQRPAAPAGRSWRDAPETFYDEYTGRVWPYLASLLYGTCSKNKILYRMFAQSMMKAMERGTFGRLGGGNSWQTAIASINGSAAAAVAPANGAAEFNTILGNGTITGLPAITATTLRLGVALPLTNASPVGIANGMGQWFYGGGVLNGGALLVDAARNWMYSSTNWVIAGGGPQLIDPAGGPGPQRSADISAVLEAIAQPPAAAADGSNCIPHLAQVMFDTLNLSGIEKLALRYLAAMPFNRDTLETLHSAGVVLPFSFLLMRPHAEYTTLSSVKMQAGTQTATTYVRDGLFEMGSDPTVGEVSGKFTYHGKTVVTKPENVIVLENSFVNGYIGGMNAKFITISDATPDRYYPAAGKYGQDHKNSDNPDLYNQRERPSMYCFLVPYGWAHDKNLPNPISLHGALHVDLADGRPSIETPDSQSHRFPGWKYYDRRFNFRQKIVPTPDVFSQPFIQQIVPTNAVAWKGHTRHYDTVNKSFGSENFTELGTGHWGSKNTYIGVADFRRGNLSKQRQS